MKRLFLTICAVVSAVAAMAGGRLEKGSVKSAILGVEKPYAVYLPEGYDTSSESYPVLYLLHGATDTFMAWPERGDMQRIADETLAEGGVRKMIIVMPDASGVGERNAGEKMGYFNVKGWAYEDFFFGEFLPHIDQTYRTIASKEGRAISGLSMGGGGATVYAQHHPELFQASYSTSGLLDLYDRLVQKPRPYYGITWLWSVEQTSPVDFLRRATPEQIASLRTVRWMLDCGDDDRLVKTNVDYFIEMKRVDVPVEFRIRDGKHNWAFWQESLPQILRFSFPKSQERAE
ncbi:MAG: endo-1,4-beta-xylanase Z [Alistipes sp.]|nr:endo-1,4-beta-xylanase Z [Alistipes sp.]